MGAGEELARTDDEQYGWRLLRLLILDGWELDIRSGFAGDGVIATASRRGVRPVQRAGESVAAIAAELLVACVAAKRTALRIVE